MTPVCAAGGREAAAGQRSGHLVIFAGCAGALLIAVVLGQLATVDRSIRIGEVTLPGTCTLRRLTGLPCAGCGLTRSWVTLAQGDLRASIVHHRVGWLVMLYVAAQALRHGAWLAVRGWQDAVERWGRWLDRGLAVLVVLLLGNWVVTLVLLASG